MILKPLDMKAWRSARDVYIAFARGTEAIIGLDHWKVNLANVSAKVNTCYSAAA